jgi:uncharacterized protein YraI
MHRGYIDSRRKKPDIIGVAGWVVALLIGIAFAWFALFGPGRSPAPAAPTAMPSPTPTETVLPSIPTTIPTDTPLPPATDAPAPTNTAVPQPTSVPSLTPTPQVTLLAGDDGANVRKGPGTYYEQLGRVEAGASAVVTGRYDEWLRIDFDGAEGWVANWIVTVSDLDSVPQVEPPSPSETVTAEPEVAPTEEVPPVEATTPVTPTDPGTAGLTAGADGANVRTGPGTLFESIGRLEPGEPAVITGRYDRWFQIDFNGTPAWVANWVVTATGAENVPEVEPPVPSPTSEVTATPAAST